MTADLLLFRLPVFGVCSSSALPPPPQLWSEQQTILLIVLSLPDCSVSTHECYDNTNNAQTLFTINDLWPRSQFERVTGLGFSYMTKCSSLQVAIRSASVSTLTLSRTGSFGHCSLPFCCSERQWNIRIVCVCVPSVKWPSKSQITVKIIQHSSSYSVSYCQNIVAFFSGSVSLSLNAEFGQLLLCVCVELALKAMFM